MGKPCHMVYIKQNTNGAVNLRLLILIFSRAVIFVRILKKGFLCTAWPCIHNTQAWLAGLWLSSSHAEPSLAGDWVTIFHTEWEEMLDSWLVILPKSGACWRVNVARHARMLCRAALANMTDDRPGIDDSHAQCQYGRNRQEMSGTNYYYAAQN